MLMQKLPQRLIKACRRYWNNKVAAANCIQGIEGVQWDKIADLEHIDSVCLKTPDLSFEACVGTFWFRKGRVCIEISERNWQEGGKRTVSK